MPDHPTLVVLPDAYPHITAASGERGCHPGRVEAFTHFLTERLGSEDLDTAFELLLAALVPAAAARGNAAMAKATAPKDEPEAAPDPQGEAAVVEEPATQDQLEPTKG